MRRLLRIGLIIAIVLGVAALGVRWFLSSSYVAHQAATHLAQMYGGPVEVEHAHVGIKNTTLNGVKLYEKDAPSGQPPWLTLGTVQADVTLSELISGHAQPHHIDASEAKVLLRFDRNGKLLTHFPSGGQSGGGTSGAGSGSTQLPEISLKHSQVTLAKEGAQPIVLNDVTASVQPKDGKLVVSADGRGARWGKLLLSGNIDSTTHAADIDLKTAGTIHVTQAMLDGLPMVPESIWKDVQTEGDTPGQLKVTYDPKADKYHYRVELEPKHTDVTVPVAALHGKDVSGTLIVEDGVVRLRNVNGQAYRGTLAGNCDLDFSGDVTRIDFTPLHAHHLDIRQLPESWGLPKEITGRLDAEGKIFLTLDHGKINTTGDAKAEIVQAKLAGQPVDGPIEIELAPEGAPLQVGDPTPTGGEQAQAPKVPPPPRRQRPTYLTVKMNLKNADLAQMVEKLELKLPFPVKGRLNFHGKAAIPMSGHKEAREYRFNGSALITQAEIGDIHLEKVETEATFQNGLLKLDKLYGVAPGAAPPVPGKPTPGTFQGTLVAQVDPPGDLTAALRMDQLPLMQAAKELGIKKEVNGEITGKLTTKISLARLQKDKIWDGSGEITVQRARALGWTLDDAVADLKFQGKQVNLVDLHGRLEGTTITGSGEMVLEKPYAYKAKVSFRDADLASAEKLAKDLRPTVNLSGRATVNANLSGTVQPFEISSKGTAQVTALQVDKLKLRQASLAWENTPDQVKVKELQAKLYGGTVTGNAVVPITDKAGGNVDVIIANIDVGRMLKDADIGLPLEGKAGGTVKGTFGPTPPGKDRPIDLTLALKAPKLKVEGIEADELHGTVRYAGEDISYNFATKTLGGTLDLEGKVPRKALAPGKEAGTGRLRARGLHLARLAPLISPHERRTPLSGRVDAEVSYRFEGPDHTPVGAGLVVVTDLAWDDTAWVDRTEAEVLLDNGRLLVRGLRANFGDGTVNGRLSFSWKHRRENWYQVTLNRVDAATLFAAWPAARQSIEGLLDASIRGTFGTELAAHGTVLLARGKVNGLEVTEGRLPFEAVYVPKGQRGRARVTAGSATVALGRLAGDMTYAWGDTQSLRGKMTFKNLDARSLLRAAAESAHLGGGKLSGNMSFSGPGFVGLDRLSATVDATLSHAQAMQWPVFSQLAPLLRLGGSSSFQSGQLRGSLDGGVFRIQRLSLKGGPANLYAHGTVNTKGRLGLDVHAGAPNVGSRTPGLRFLAGRMTGASAVPVALLSRASNLLSSQLVHARVTGTVRSPTIQIMPLRSLQEDAVRFFVGGSGNSRS